MYPRVCGQLLSLCLSVPARLKTPVSLSSLGRTDTRELPHIYPSAVERNTRCERQLYYVLHGLTILVTFIPRRRLRIDIDSHKMSQGQTATVHPNQTSSGPNSRSGTPPGSLVISPNLDALLEHDERVRHGRLRSFSPLNSTSASPMSPFFNTPLPPPPRGPRKYKVPNSPNVYTKANSFDVVKTGGLLSPSPTGLDTRTFLSAPNSPASPWTGFLPNPYINPAPLFDEVSKAGDAVLQMSSSLAMALDISPDQDDDLGMHPSEAPELEDEIKSRDGYTPPSLANTRRLPNVHDDPKQPSNSQQQSRYPLLRVDKLLSRGKIGFGFFPESGPQKQTQEGEHTSVSLPTVNLNLRERARSKGKLLKLKDVPSTSSRESYFVLFDSFEYTFLKLPSLGKHRTTCMTTRSSTYEDNRHCQTMHMTNLRL